MNYEAAALDMRNSHPSQSPSWGAGEQADVYILKGEGTEVWHPRFTVHGFRYVEVIGYPGELTLDAVVGWFDRTSVLVTSRLSRASW